MFCFASGAAHLVIAMATVAPRTSYCGRPRSPPEEIHDAEGGGQSRQYRIRLRPMRPIGAGDSNGGGCDEDSSRDVGCADPVRSRMDFNFRPSAHACDESGGRRKRRQRVRIVQFVHERAACE